ncbi:MAG: hypothetical protein JWP44_4523 [Mucilaginibacter sp.]|nr:hypothetical protein [Mucilaginibacter sp.]
MEATALIFGAKNSNEIHEALAQAGIAPAEVVVPAATYDFDFDGGPVRGYVGPAKTYYRNSDLDVIVDITAAHEGYVWLA